MKQLVKLSFLFLLITTFGCNSDDNHAECNSIPEHFIFQFIDKDSGENLFANGTYDPKQQILVTNLKTADIIQLSTLKSEDAYSLSIANIGWISEKIAYEISFYQSKTIFSLYVDAERISGKCTYTKFNSVEIKNAPFQLDKTTGIYKILIDTKP